MRQGDTDHGSSQQLSEPRKRVGRLKEVKFGILQRVQEVAGEGTRQRSAVMEKRATPLPSWPTAVTRQLFLIWQKAPLLPQESICERQSRNAALASHPEFPTSALITIQWLISGFVWENSGPALDVAFTLDKIHDRNPEALVYCKGGGYLFTISYKWDRNHVHARSRRADLLRVEEKKCGNQNRTAIKVNSLKAETGWEEYITGLWAIDQKCFLIFLIILHEYKNWTEVGSKTWFRAIIPLFITRRPGEANNPGSRAQNSPCLQTERWLDMTKCDALYRANLT